MMAPVEGAKAGRSQRGTGLYRRDDLWRVYRFAGYFREETVAVFFDSWAAVDFAQTDPGYYVGEQPWRRQA